MAQKLILVLYHRLPLNLMNKNTGFTLIEVLIAMLVLAVGLLGLAGLQATSLKNNQSAYNRSQATQLAYDIADRMRSNPSVGGNFYLTAFSCDFSCCNLCNPTDTPCTACATTANSCTPAEISREKNLYLNGTLPLPTLYPQAELAQSQSQGLFIPLPSIGMIPGW